MKALIILLIGLSVFAVLILWSALTVPLSDYERMKDDEAQMEYLRKWRAREKNG